MGKLTKVLASLLVVTTLFGIGSIIQPVDATPAAGTMSARAALLIPEGTIWITQRQIIFGPTYTIRPGQGVAVLAYQSTPTDTAWTQWCFNIHGTVYAPIWGIPLCYNIVWPG